jgi:hypothetical protein
LPKVVERNEDDDGGQRSDKSEVKNQSMVMYVLTLMYFMMMILIREAGVDGIHVTLRVECWIPRPAFTGFTELL